MTTQAAPTPPISRSSMTPLRWAGRPWLRPLYRWLRPRAVPSWRATADVQSLMLRRVALLAVIVLGAIVGTDYMVDVLPKHGAGWAEQGLLLLFGVLFAWISAGFWTGLMGAWVMLRGYDRQSVTRVLQGAAGHAALPPEARTAIIMPICNEHVPTVFGGLRATVESLARTDWLERFDVFVLSDTNDPQARVAEQAAWSALVTLLAAQGHPAAHRIHYRWRQHRTRRKAGNVADFCRRFGAAYRYMVVLDADSVMTGECLVSLVRLMQAHPDAGIIQTAPSASGHDTVHARVQQFGSSVYGPLFTAGMHFWQLGESHYWGHNAILRMAPFIEHCALDALPGSGSLSGHVMSHDFVEAALMRRAGWKVWIAHDLPGSYEQVPPNLLAELQRDRRWCHGNLQNSRLMFEPGLHPVHRAVFLTGVLAYASAPLWLGFLLLSSVLFASQTHEIPRYFLEPYQLFPIWPSAHWELMLTLFGLTALMLFAPKVLSLSVIILRGQARRHGGVAAMLLSAVLEFVYSSLLAPVRMLFHTQFVLAAITGLHLDWKSPPRDDAATPWREAMQRHGWHTLLAGAWIAAIVVTSQAFAWWLMPVMLGLLLAIPLSVLGSQAAPGRWLRARGLFLIPEEQRVPQVLREARDYAEAFGALAQPAQAVTSDVVHELVVQALPRRAPARGLKAHAQAALVGQAVTGGPQALSKAHWLRLLGDAQALHAVRVQILAHQAHPEWTTASRMAVPVPRRASVEPAVAARAAAVAVAVH